MNVQEMEYKLSQYCNHNVQTLPFLTKADIIERFRKSCTKEGIEQSNILKYFRILRLWQISAGNSCTEDQRIHTFLETFQQGGKYYTQIASHQAELRREEKTIDQK